MKPKILLVGAGKFGVNHLRVLKELEKEGICELRGVADKNPQTLVKIGNPPAMTMDYRKLLDEADAVDVVTPSDTHYPIVKECLEAGKHVFVEKPLATRFSDAKELVELAETKNRTLMVGHVFRCNFAVQKIKHLINSGELGKIYYMTGHFTGLKSPRLDVGALFNFTVHHIDIYNYLLDEKPVEVTATTGNFLGRKQFEDLACVVLRYGSGAVGIIEGSWLPPGKHRDLTVVGSKRSVVSDLFEQTVEIHHGYIDGNLQAVANKTEKQTLPFDVRFREPLKVELQDFVRSINTGLDPTSSGYSALTVVHVAEKALESAKLGRTVSLNG